MMDHLNRIEPRLEFGPDRPGRQLDLVKALLA